LAPSMKEPAFADLAAAVGVIVSGKEVDVNPGSDISGEIVFVKRFVSANPLVGVGVMEKAVTVDVSAVADAWVLLAGRVEVGSKYFVGVGVICWTRVAVGEG
jgi:hypothetical protein